MKILYLIDTLSLGGAQTVCKGIFENQRSNTDIFLLALRKTSISVQIDHKNVEIFSSNRKYTLSYIKRIRRIIKEQNIQILHCQLPKSQISGYLIKKFYFPNIKLILHEQGDVFKNPLWRFILNIISRKADKLIVCSKATLNKIKIPKNKIEVLYNYVDLDFFIPKIGNIESSNFVIGFVGRLVKRKGWREFVKLAKLCLENTNWHFKIAGDGRDRKKLEKMLKNSGSNIEYIGVPKNIVSYYHSLDCLIIPSHWEPMGMVAIEAMACGTPVIANNVEGLSEFVINKKTGLDYSLDIKFLKDAIIKLSSNNDLNKEIVKNSNEAVKCFSYLNFQKRYSNILNSL